MFLPAAKYCGQPPLIDNGYVESSTGVQFGDDVMYKCYNGYTTSVPSVACKNDGQWEDAPTCSRE